MEDMDATNPRTAQSTLIDRGNPLLQSYGWVRSTLNWVDMGTDRDALEALGIRGLYAANRPDFGPWDVMDWTHSNDYNDPVTGVHKPVSKACWRSIPVERSEVTNKEDSMQTGIQITRCLCGS